MRIPSMMTVSSFSQLNKYTGDVEINIRKSPKVKSARIFFSGLGKVYS